MSTTEKPYKIGMVFGVFDGFHPGHQFFLSEAAKRCEQLIVVVALHEMVLCLKRHAPKYSFKERAAMIRAFDNACKILPSDTEPGTWGALRAHNPDTVILGHDQHRLAEELRKLGVPFVHIEAHRPDRFKSSLLHQDL